MGIEIAHLLGAVVVGIGATLITDLWALLLKRVFKIPSLSFCLVGRWLLHMREGTFRHRSIAAARQKPSECTVGWIAHYATGVVFALVFLALVSGSWLAQPTPVPALLFGLCTVAFPFLLMQPSFGLGVAASRTPNPAQARMKSLVTHIVFGAGLYASAVALSRFFHINA